MAEHIPDRLIELKARVRALQRRLYVSAKASPERSYGILHDKVFRWDVLVTAWGRVAANRGAPGIDGQSIDWIKHEYGVARFLRELQAELAAGRYRPLPVRGQRIPKSPGQTRLLGIPVVRDRVAQMAVKLVIEPLFEADFCDCSYGFRPKRSNTQAAQLVHKLVNRLKWVVDVDIAGYFDTIPHEALMGLVRRRVRDRRVLHLIRGWLTAGTMESGELVCGVRGTPQGGVLSPLLSNIYLHELDRQWDSADGKLVRFADDFVILCRTERQAHAALATVRVRVAALELAVNEGKTRVGHVRDGFDFLGFTYREAYSERHQRLVRIKTPRVTSQTKVRRHLKARLQQVPLGLPLSEAVTCANRTLRGWATYFRIGNSYEAGLSLTHYACAQVRLWLRRKKHRKDRRCLRKWPDRFFYSRGLCYVPALLRS